MIDWWGRGVGLIVVVVVEMEMGDWGEDEVD